MERNVMFIYVEFEWCVFYELTRQLSLSWFDKREKIKW